MASTNPAIPPSPEAATPAGVAAASDPNAKRRIWVNIPPQPPYVDARTGRPVAVFPLNEVRTSKYTCWNFLPKNLFEQFRSVANFYFITLVVLQMFSAFANISFILAAAPILFILAVTAIK
ncbi:hypothetical protein BDK51DRAFT_32282, partial [Blyttiomyces helicus]